MKKLITLLGLLLFLAPAVSHATGSDEFFLVGKIVKFDQFFLFLKSGSQSYKIPMKNILYPKLEYNEEIKVTATEKLVREWAVPSKTK